MTSRQVPESMLSSLVRTMIHDRRIRFCVTVPPHSEREWSAGFSGFDPAALVVVWDWSCVGQEDQLMPPEHGPRLAERLPHGRLVTAAGSRTVVPLDQPRDLAAHLSFFVARTARSGDR
jgi:pimeloyl-ACP methyl ester carboxylesterase